MDDRDDTTRNNYIEFLAANMAPEMKPFLSDLIVPCDCGAEAGRGRYEWRCMGWRLQTMIRSELPPEARARRSPRQPEVR